jgi:hypothetical protein
MSVAAESERRRLVSSSLRLTLIGKAQAPSRGTASRETHSSIELGIASTTVSP